MPRKIINACVRLLIICALQQSAYAAQWDWGSRLGLGGNWNDNPALADDARNPQSTFRVVASYSGEFMRLGPSSTLTFRPRVTRDWYPDKQFKDLESTDLFLPGSYNLVRRRSNWALGYNVSRQNVLSDEQTISQDLPGSNLNADDIVYRASLSPNFSWYASEKDQIIVGIRGFLTNYELDFTQRADATGVGASFSYLRSVTERQSVGFSASIDTTESENLNLCPIEVDPGPPPLFTLVECTRFIDTTSDSLTLDYGFNFSENSKFSLKWGLQNSESEQETIENSTGQPLFIIPIEFESTTYDISYNKITKNGQFGLTGTRRVTPATNGRPQDRYEIVFNGKNDLSPKLNFRWVMRVWEQQGIGFASTGGEFNLKTRYFGTDLFFIWKLSRKWTLNGNYRFAYRDRDAGINSTNSFTARSNAIGLGVGYAWKRIKK